MSPPAIYKRNLRRARIVRVAMKRAKAERPSTTGYESSQRGGAAGRDDYLEPELELTARPKDEQAAAVGGAWVGTQIPKGLR